MVAASIWVLGAGGHAKIVISAARAAQIPVGLVFDDHARPGDVLVDVAVGSPIPSAFEDIAAHVGIGSNRARKAIAEGRPGWTWATICHPAAVIDTCTRVGEGTFVGAMACVQIDAVVGRHVIVNTGASIDHDCMIGDYAHIGPGVALCGNVVVGEGALLGVGSCVAPGITIGAWAVVGAGAVVVRDVPAAATVVGNPACPLVRGG